MSYLTRVFVYRLKTLNLIVTDHLFSSDLSFAIQYCRVLKLTILSGNQEQKTGTVLPSLDQLRLDQII